MRILKSPPDIVLNNPFRVLGLFVNASEREITKRVKDLKIYTGTGKVPLFISDYPCFPECNRTKENIEEAKSKIEQLEQRLFHSFFWFSNTNSVDELALEVLREGKTQKAIDLWEKAVNRDIGDTDEEMELDIEVTKNGYAEAIQQEIIQQEIFEEKLVLSKKDFPHAKNLSVLYLGLSIQGKEINQPYFRKGLALAGRVFLSTLPLRQYCSNIGGTNYQFDRDKIAISFTDEILRQMKPLLDEGIDHGMLKEIVHGFSLFPEEPRRHVVDKLVKKPIRFIETKVLETEGRRKKNPLEANGYGEELYMGTHENLLVLKDILSVFSLRYQKIADIVADEIFSCSVDFFNRHREVESGIDPGKDALRLAQYADSIAVDARIKDRLRNGIPIIEEWIRDKPNRERLKKTDPHINYIIKQLNDLPDPEPASTNKIILAYSFLEKCLPKLTALRNIFKDISGSAPSLLILEKFEDNKNEWTLKEDDPFFRKIDNGKYFLDNQDNTNAYWASWAFNHLEFEEFDDFSIECSITKLKGTNNNGFGLVWAYKKADDNTKYSTFRITGEGHYFYGKYDSEWVNEFKWTESPHIFHDNGTNILAIHKVGSLLTFYINNHFIGEDDLAESVSGQSIGFVVNSGISIEVNYLYFCNSYVLDFQGLIDFEYYQKISSAVASRTLDFCIAYANIYRDKTKPLGLMKKIKLLDMTPELRERLARNESILKQNLQQTKIVVPSTSFTKPSRFAWAVFLFFIVLIVLVVLGVILNSNSPKNQNQETSTVAPAEVLNPETVPPKPDLIVKPPLLEKPLPRSGSIKIFNKAERVAPFEIKAGQGSHYLLKLVDADTKARVMTIFIRSGTTVKVKVPTGIYDVRYASGNAWHGYKHLFGPSGVYSKADQLFEFEIQGDHVLGHSLTLYRTTNGNLRITAISPEEF